MCRTAFSNPINIFHTKITLTCLKRPCSVSCGQSCSHTNVSFFVGLILGYRNFNPSSAVYKDLYNYIFGNSKQSSIVFVWIDFADLQSTVFLYAIKVLWDEYIHIGYRLNKFFDRARDLSGPVATPAPPLKKPSLKIQSSSKNS